MANNYVAGNVSILPERMVHAKLYDFGFSQTDFKQKIIGWHCEPIAVDMRIRGHGMACDRIRFVVIDDSGAQVGKPFAMLQSGLRFKQFATGELVEPEPGQLLVGYSKETIAAVIAGKGVAQGVRVQVLSSEEAICDNFYCYSISPGVYALGAGATPSVFLFAEFQEPLV